MSGVWYLAVRRALYQRRQTAILAVCVAVTVFLPVASALVAARYQKELEARAAATPQVLGSRGSHFDLVLTALYFRPSAFDPVPYGEYQRLLGSGLGVAVPLNLRFTARGRTVVATTPEYYDQRRLVATAGTRPLALGEAALGADVAASLGLGPGDALFSDQRELYDISKPPALKMRVAGVLARSGTPDDGAVFVDLKTAWILEGIAHGHQDVTGEVDPSLILKRTEGAVAVSPAMLEYQEVTPENVDAFHLHGDLAKLPLTAVLFFPTDARAATMIKARINASKVHQMVVPRDVVRDLLAFVFRIKSLLDALSVVLAASTALLFGLVVLLQVRLRAAETRTLDRIGCRKRTVAALLAADVLLVVALGVLLAAALLGLGLELVPRMVDVL